MHKSDLYRKNNVCDELVMRFIPSFTYCLKVAPGALSVISSSDEDSSDSLSDLAKNRDIAEGCCQSVEKYKVMSGITEMQLQILRVVYQHIFS